MQIRIFIKLVALITSITNLSTSAQDSILNTVPMQGGMAMPAIRYMADHGHLMVMMPNTVPHLTPLEESHPDMHFNAESPWFEDLDPTAKGMAFNRQYGFVMDGTSDLLPLGTAIWIEMVSADHGLQVYKYRSINEEDQTWEPIFGSGGSSPVFEWDMRMFHPAFAAPKESGPLSAEFKAFVADVNTGEVVEEIEGAHFTLSWTADSPEGMPELSIARQIVLSWEGAFGHHMLQSTHDIESGEWTPMHVTPTLMNGKYVVILDHSHHGMFFRLAPHTP